MNAPPIEAFEQGREPSRAQPHHAIMDLWPAERAALQSLRDQHHAGAVSEDQLNPIRTLRPKNIDDAAERIVLDHLPHQRGQTFGPFAEVHRLGCYHYLNSYGRVDHRIAFSAWTMAAIIAAFPATSPDSDVIDLDSGTDGLLFSRRATPRRERSAVRMEP